MPNVVLENITIICNLWKALGVTQTLTKLKEKGDVIHALFYLIFSYLARNINIIQKLPGTYDMVTSNT